MEGPGCCCVVSCTWASTLLVCAPLSSLATLPALIMLLHWTLDTAYLSCDMLSCPGGYRVQRSPNTTRSVFTHISFKLSNRIDSTWHHIILCFEYWAIELDNSGTIKYTKHGSWGSNLSLNMNSIELSKLCMKPLAQFYPCMMEPCI